MPTGFAKIIEIGFSKNEYTSPQKAIQFLVWTLLSSLRDVSFQITVLFSSCSRACLHYFNYMGIHRSVVLAYPDYFCFFGIVCIFNAWSPGVNPSVEPRCSPAAATLVLSAPFPPFLISSSHGAPLLVIAPFPLPLLAFFAFFVEKRYKCTSFASGITFCDLLPASTNLIRV